MNGYSLELSDDDFLAFAELVHRKAGIHLHQGKKELVRSRLARRIWQGEFAGFNDYFQHVVNDESGDELVWLLDAIATNTTSFFREPKHFSFMTQTFLPDMYRSGRKGVKDHMRIWSAGCSTGEEPYSIAMTILEKSRQLPRPLFKVLATDISTKALEVARRGVYSSEELAGLPLGLLRRYFRQGQGRWAGCVQIKQVVRQAVAFRWLNLIDPFPFHRDFDLIFCRNVMIYFDKKTQADLVGRFFQVLAPGGYLFIGHAESLGGTTHGFQYVQPTVYRK